MGCGGSKTVAVRETTSVTIPANDTDDFNNNHPEINLIVDSQQDDADVNACNNAKPRLVHSAIRRNTQPLIKPVVNDSNRTGIDDGVEYNTIIGSSNSNGHVITADMLRGSDSGLGNISALSVNTEKSRPKSSTTTTPYKNRTKTPSFGIKSVDNSNRPDSGKTGSILTTSALNASFMTTGDDDISYNVDVTLDLHTPFSEYTDMEENTFRTLSITPSTPGMPMEPTPIMYNKQIGVIREESEGGFTPRSVDYIEEVHKSVQYSHIFLPKYLPREIFSHNDQVGKPEWLIYKKKAYDRNLIISTFSHIVKEYLRIRVQERKRLRREYEERDKRKNTKLRLELQEEERDEEQEMKPKHEDNENEDEKETGHEIQRDSQGTVALSSSIDDELSARYHTHECEETNYTVNEDYIYYAEDFENCQTWNEIGIESLLRLDLDSNVINKNMPTCCVGEVVQPNTPRYWNDVRNDISMVLDQLNQSYVCDELTANEMDLKEQLGAWLRQHGDHNPCTRKASGGDPNKRVFPLPTRSLENPLSLRCWLEEWVPLDFGNPDWQVLPANVIEDDILTSNQEAVETSRKLRSDLKDHRRMEKRRDNLTNYFMTKYEMQASDMDNYTKWATVMEEAARAFQKLCELA